jgi:hypothetical protein
MRQINDPIGGIQGRRCRKMIFLCDLGWSEELLVRAGHALRPSARRLVTDRYLSFARRLAKWSLADVRAIA